MRNPPASSLVHELPATLWLSAHRSKALTPVYIERYRGPRQTKKTIAHAYWELTAVMSGSEALVGRTPMELHSGTVCLIPPGYRHDESADHEVDTIWLGFQCRQQIPARYRSVPTVVTSKSLIELISQMWIFAATTHGPIGPELDAQLANILHRFIRLTTENIQEPAADAIQIATEYLMNHHAEDLHMPDVARRHGFSTGHFCRQFRKRTGLAPNAYLTHIRLQTAAQFLRQSTLSVKEIASRVGLHDEAYFSRLFKKKVGIAPAHYQRSHSH